MKKLASLLISFMLLLALSSPLHAHPGRTDANEGHRDNNNVSGLGSYHYHCNDTEAHLHDDGVCPFALEPLPEPITVVLDGVQLFFDVAPIVESGRILVPMRAIFEAMGADVNWDGETQTVVSTKAAITVILQVGAVNPTVNGVVKPLDVPAILVDDRIFAPLRFVGEAFGGTVEWDDATRTVYIVASVIATDDATNDSVITVHFIDVGQADAVYIQLPDNNDIVIDGGKVSSSNKVVKYLQDQGLDDIELYIGTHPHEDHMGATEAILKAFEVKEILENGRTSTAAFYKRYEDIAKAGDYLFTAADFQTYTFGDANLFILSGNDKSLDINNSSVICLLDTGEVRFLFMGDAEEPAEKKLTGDISANILRAGHHGSKVSGSEAFLVRVSPEVAIIQVGSNSYGHPTQEALSRLLDIDALIYRTDVHGNIVVTVTGDTYAVQTEKNQTVLSNVSQLILFSRTLGVVFSPVPGMLH